MFSWFVKSLHFFMFVNLLYFLFFVIFLQILYTFIYDIRIDIYIVNAVKYKNCMQKSHRPDNLRNL